MRDIRSVSHCYFFDASTRAPMKEITEPHIVQALVAPGFSRPTAVTFDEPKQAKKNIQ